MDLRVVRFLHGLTQQELQRATGICQSRISTVERGFSVLSKHEKERLNFFLKKSRVSLNAILYVERQRNGNSTI